MNLCKAFRVLALAGVCGGAAAQTTHTVPGNFPTIQAAIDAAASGDTILVDPGVYVESIDYSGKDLAIQAPGGPGATALDGNLTHTLVVFANGETSAALLEGFTIYRGQGGALPPGGIYCKNSSPTIRGCIIRLNRGALSGGVGAIHCDNAAPTLIECDIRRNFGGTSPAPTPSAGALACENGSALVAIDCDFRFNEGLTYDQGGGDGVICCVTQSSASFDGCSFLGNLGGRGGRAGAGVGSFQDSQGTFTNCSFDANVGGPGGLDPSHRGGDGVFEFDSSTGSITDCSFGANVGGTEGADGAIHCLDSGVEIRGSSFAGNMASPGSPDAGSGAITVQGASNLLVEDSTFDDNVGAAGAGAIRIAAGALFDISGGLFRRNLAAGLTHAAGAILAESDGTIASCEFRNNSGAAGAAGAVTTRAAVLVDRCYFEGNQGGDGSGPKAGAGALEVFGTVAATVRACRFRANLGGDFPGGIGGSGAVGFRGGHSSLLENCLIWLNTGGDGDIGGAGAISCNSGSVGGASTIQNATLTRNTAGLSSGAIPGAGGIHTSELAEPFIVNTISWGNFGGDELLCTGCVSGPSVSHCLIAGGYPGPGNRSADPLFVGPVAENFRPRCPSPCRDAGTDSGLSLALDDLDGLARVLGEGVDMGAYEIISPGAGSNYCVSTLNSTGFAAVIDAGGCNVVGEGFLPLRATQVPNTVGLFYYGPAQIQIPFGDGFRCVGGGGGAFYRLRFRQIENNTLTTLLEYLSPNNPAGRIHPGSTWNFQGVFRDPAAGGAEFNLTDGLQITFVP